jgi:hypothetical protein
MNNKHSNIENIPTPNTTDLEALRRYIHAL